MDAAGAGDLIAELNALALRSPRELWAFMAGLGRADLAGLVPHLPHDCTPDCADPCPRAETPLCVEAIAFLLWVTNPKAYADPRPPAAHSCNTNPETQVSVMADRRRRREALWHPNDWIRLGVDAGDGRLARQPTRLRNGADAVGELTLEAADED